MTRRRRMAEDRGNALITAVLVMLLFTALGLSALSFVDTQQRESGRERVRESSFALAEGVLTNQIYLLGRAWPGQLTEAYPDGSGGSYCTPASGTDPDCPDQAAMQAAFTGVDYAAGVTWQSEIHDNAAPVTGQDDNFYDDAVVRTRRGWDANGDGFLWVRAQAHIHGRRRTLVALVRAEELTLNFPRNVIVAGKLQVQSINNQNKVYVVPQGSYISLRCAGTTYQDPNCRGYYGPQSVGQAPIQPAEATPALSPEAVDRLRALAKSRGTWYASGCVPEDKIAGQLVFIERADCAQAYNPPGNGNSASGAWNSPQAPGTLVVGRGVLKLGGNSTYHGVIYHINGSDTPTDASDDTTYYTGSANQFNNSVVQIDGTTCVLGSVVIDGTGGLYVGSSGGSQATPCGAGNVRYSEIAANRFKTYGTAGIVQNSFREIQAAN